LVVGCGDDTAVPYPEAGADVTADVVIDTAPDITADRREAGGPDVTAESTADTGSEADATVVDVAADTGSDGDATVDANDGGADGNMGDADSAAADADGATTDGDAEVDGGVDADADAPSDAEMDADADADAGPNALEQYADANAQAFCQGQGKCCPGDGGGFNVAACARDYYAGGWRYWLPSNPAAYTAGNLTLNTSQANTCIAALQAFPCGGTVSASQFATIVSACNGVLTGTIATGSGGCVSSFECANGYCNLAMDGGGGTGTCTALVGDGGACTSGPDSPDQMCAQAGNQAGNSRLWCNLTFSTDGGGTCAPPLADTAACYNMNTSSWDDYGCASLMCGDNGCGGTTAAYPDPVFCSSYIDGGGGG
jgi:hypothetical protein